MTTVVSPAKVQYGDQVYIHGQAWVVKDVSGPDNHGAYDFYITDGLATKHEVIADVVTLVL
jgi:hypothetical protein